MLVSKPINLTGGSISNITITDSGYQINNDKRELLSLNNVMELYFMRSNSITNTKLENNYINYFFNDKDEFIFITPNIDDIKKQINFLNEINDLTIKSFINEHNEINTIQVINFFIRFITELTKFITNKNTYIEQLYSLVLKNNELLNLLNKENNVIIKNILNCYNQILQTLHKENIDMDNKNDIMKLQDVINNETKINNQDNQTNNIQVDNPVNNIQQDNQNIQQPINQPNIQQINQSNIQQINQQ